MKIGIISINMYSKGLNFACPLHTYAFQQFLLKNGIESTVINYKPIYYDNFDLKHPYDYYMKRYQAAEKKEAVTQEEREARELRLQDLREKCENLKELYEEREIRYEKFQNFIDTRYIKTEMCYDSDLLEVLDPGFDCYICATDVIWKNEPGFGFDRGFFLASTCMENKWKIAYAGSMNARKSKTPEEDALFFQYIGDMDRISVREESLKHFIEENTGQEVTLVVDPVLLHEKEFYDDITVRPPEEHYLLLYYVMEKARDTLQQAVTYAKTHHLKIVELTERAESGGRLQEYTDVETVYRYGIGIEEWLGYIRYADCVFTNSFHACCFCALFEKKFFAGKRHGDKVGNILNLLGLSDRRINVKSDLVNSEPPEIDYEEVRKNLKKWREESGAFILNAIHELEGKQKEIKDYVPYKKSLSYKVIYNTGLREDSFTWNYTGVDGIIKKTVSGTYEFQPYKNNAVNSGEAKFRRNGFYHPMYQFRGWKIRFRIDNRWFWYLDDDSICLKSEYNKNKHAPIRIFEEEASIPYIPVNRIAVMVAEGVWEDTSEKVVNEPGLFRIKYNSGGKGDYFSDCYAEQEGVMKKTPRGSYEFYSAQERIVNNGESRFRKNQFSRPGYQFVGWKLRTRIDHEWFWYLSDGTLCQKDFYTAECAPIEIFPDESLISPIPAPKVRFLVAVAVWEKLPTNDVVGTGAVKETDEAVDKERDLETDHSSQKTEGIIGKLFGLLK